MFRFGGYIRRQSQVGWKANRMMMPSISSGALGPLQVSGSNSRYFTNRGGKAIILAGSHTWDNRQDIQGAAVFDWIGYLDDLETWGHNFIRLWVWIESKNITTSPAPVDSDALISPEVYKRTGPGNANDGGLKFDLTQYNQVHFDRLRTRCIEAGNRGIYVSIMLFQGWGIDLKGGGLNPWIHHPYSGDNNINSIEGDPNSNDSGRETHTLDISAVTDLQESYVEKVIDTVNDLDNVLYEISNESYSDSVAWQNHMIDHIHTYEATKSKQHPVWFTGESGITNADMLASNAEAIAPSPGTGYDDPPAADGTKVLINDTDHVYGIGGNAAWAWRTFSRGLNPIYMDSWANQVIDASGSGHPIQNFRDNLGYIRSLANLADLISTVPQNGGTSPCQTGYCLYGGEQYICYQPNSGNFNLDLTSESGTFNIRKVNLANGSIDTAQTVTGGAVRSITQPSGWTSGWACLVNK